jgi:hypothetical protein
VYSDGRNGYFGQQPLCAIEVKGFNPARKLVLQDLSRNLEFLRVRGPTGASELEFTLLASMHSYERHRTDEQIAKNLERARACYLQWIAELGPMSDVRFNVDTFTVRKEQVGRVIDEGEYSTLDSDATHHFVGAIVSFQAQPASK